MILPKDIKGYNRIRDFKICQMYMQEGMTLQEIGQKFGLTKQAIDYVILKHKSVFKIDKEFEKLKRLNRLKRIFDSCSDRLSPNKDILNVIEQMRKEFEGENIVNLITQFLQIEKPSSEIKTRLDEIQAN